MRRELVLLWLAAMLSGAVAMAATPKLSGVQVEPSELNQLQPGTTLPVALRKTLRAGKTPVGTAVTALTTQRVPVGPKAWMHHGAQLSGVVTASSNQGGVAMLTIRFDELHYRGQTIPVKVDALAVASNMEVNQTGLPANGSSDRENSNPASWTTAQVGGDEVYRSGWQGPMCDDLMRTVGFADFNGVYMNPPAHGGPDFPLAMGPFSTSARGLYGYDEGDRLNSADGMIRIEGPFGKVELRDGDNLLLRVIASAKNPV